MDKLEKYIENNRQEFDDKHPEHSVWLGISRRLIKSSNNYSWIWRVAAVFFFCTSVFLYFYQPDKRIDTIAERQKLSNDFGDIETYYFQIIAEKTELIYDYDTQKAPIEVDFEQDIQKLDAMYQVLKDELQSNPSKKVVDALILNLLVRIDVLNEKIEELEDDEESVEPAEEDLSI